MRSFIMLLFAKYKYIEEVKKDEIGRTCRTNGKEEE
jgi:hypothetical protein